MCSKAFKICSNGFVILLSVSAYVVFLMLYYFFVYFVHFPFVLFLFIFIEYSY